MINAFSIDVEDYWKNYSRDVLGYDAPPSDAVVRCTGRLLEILSGFDAKATFFVVGEVAQKYPGLVKEIAAAGHEVGSHGLGHYQANKISREKFVFEITESKKVIEDILGSEVKGHRATSFTVTPNTKWALDDLSEAGYLYDSSVFPFQGRRYGWPGFCRDVCRVKLSQSSEIIEVPMTVVDFMGKKLPACGGGYLRHFPYAYTQWAIKRVVLKRPFIVYIHPYDIDVSPPPSEDYAEVVSNAALWPKVRNLLQLRNRSTVEGKLKKMLASYSFISIVDLITHSGVLAEVTV